MFEALLAAWIPHKGLKPPRLKKSSCGEAERVVFGLETFWGPPIPYPPADHLDGDKNHGYRRIKGNLAALDAIPEVGNVARVATVS